MKQINKQANYKMLNPVFIFISWLYGFSIWARNICYDKDLIKTIIFEKPIISIGNIMIGGTGKTPLVICFAKLLLKNKKKPGVISRGYARKSNGMVVVHDGKNSLVDAETAGDEPYLIAQNLNIVPVVVCENKSLGIRELLDNYSVDVVIMDDGFQHRKVKRNLDVCSVSKNNKISDYRLFPLGYLREPVRNINRADVVIYTKTEKFKAPLIHSKIQSHFKGKIIYSSIVNNLMKYDKSGYHKTKPIKKSFFAFCGIADPDSFINSATQLGLEIEGMRLFKDHQNYTNKIIKQLSEQIRRTNSHRHVLTTEKDMVKLSNNFIEEFEVYVIKIDVVFKNESMIRDTIKTLF